MGFLVTENYQELWIWVRIVTQENLQLWTEFDTMIDFFVLLNIGTLVGIILFFTLVTADGTCLELDKIPNLCQMIRSKNVFFLE